MARDFAPLPLDYLDIMQPLNDEEFGKICRALLHYARDGEPVALEGDARFYNQLVMIKDDYYAQKCQEEEEKARKRQDHARTAAARRHTKPSPAEEAEESEEPEEIPEPEADHAPEAETPEIEKKSAPVCSGLLEHARADKYNTNQITSNQYKTNHVMSNQVISNHQKPNPRKPSRQNGSSSHAFSAPKPFASPPRSFEKTDFGHV